ncbi:MAG: AbrB/MazE/SpoVT family DNA-binding domain-containing protein [Candidatus Nanohaloarchaea archaeon]|nr:AbrB/MazE/SpoVT family DNA-binding domain-containing protein [Candidatus Nanohaloarchaea archaeon]
MVGKMEIDTTKMSSRGQVIVPKKIRRDIGAEKGDIFTVASADENTVVLKKIDKEKLIAEFRDVREELDERLSQEDIDEEIKAFRKEREDGD